MNKENGNTFYDQEGRKARFWAIVAVILVHVMIGIAAVVAHFTHH